MKKKRLFITLLITIVTALAIFACGDETFKDSFPEYGFTGEENYAEMEIDNGIVIDGVFDEDIWSDCKNTYTVVSDDGAHLMPDGTRKSMTVKTYFGEKGVYVAFDVKDSLIFYNQMRTQSRNTGVELYFAPLSVMTHGGGNKSIRITPTLEQYEPVVAVRDVLNGYDYDIIDVPGTTKVAALIDGTLNNGDDYDNGYTVELAFSWDLLGGKPLDMYQFTAAFVQCGSYDRDQRYANTFIEGTSWNGVAGWKAISNDGYVNNKIEIYESSLGYDDFITIDGKLTEDQWVEKINGNKGRSITYNKKGITSTTYTLMTEKGLYLGIECNDNSVYYADGRAAKYNTGAEIWIVPAGETQITANALQVRFNVGGTGDRWRGNPTASGYVWAKNYYPAIMKGSVINGEMNSKDTEGWVGEIFIPWESFNVKNPEDMDEIALSYALYHSESTDNFTSNSAASSKGWEFISMLGYQSEQCNPQKKFMLFTKDDGFVYNELTIKNQSVDVSTFVTGATIIANNPMLASKVDANQNYYFLNVDVNAKDVEVPSGFTLGYKPYNGILSTEQDIDFVYENNSDRQFTIYIPVSQETVEKLIKTVEFSYTIVGGTARFNVVYDGLIRVDGVINSADVLSVTMPKSGKVTINNVFAEVEIDNEFWVVTEENGIYVTAQINTEQTSKFTSFNLALSTGKLDAVNTIMLKVDKSGVGEVYNFNKKVIPGTKSPWVYDGEKTASVMTSMGTKGNGYIVEAKLPWSVFEKTEMADYIYAMPSVQINYDGTGSYEVYGSLVEKNSDFNTKLTNYLTFDAYGFAPTKMYALERINFVDGENVTGTNYERKVKVSYLPYGGLESDEEVDLKLDKETVENLSVNFDENEPIEVEVNGFTVPVSVAYVKPDATTFDIENALAYLSFDNGAENITAKKYIDTLVKNTATNAFIDGADYSGDKEYVANMAERAIKVPVSLGRNDFTVSMTINADELKAFGANRYPFVLFGTGNLSGIDGFTVSYASNTGFVVKTPTNKFDAKANLSTFNGVVNLTVSFDRENGLIKFFVDGNEVASIDNKFYENYDVEVNMTMGIGYVGAKDDGTYANKSVTIDDVLILGEAIDDRQQLFDVMTAVKALGQKTLFTTDVNEIKHNFNTLTGVDQDRVTTITVSATIDGEISVGGGWSQFASVNGNVITLTMDKADMFSAMENPSYYEVNGIKKYVTIDYTDFGALSVDSSVTEIWTGDAIGGIYKFDVLVQSNGIAVEDGNGVTFTSKNLGKLESRAIGGGYYEVELDAQEVEGFESDEISVSINGREDIESVTFDVTFRSLTQEEINELAQGAVALYNFDGNVTNLITGKDATIAKRFTYSTQGYAVYADNNTAYVANMFQRTLTTNDVTLGTESFTVSALINGYDLKHNATQQTDGHSTLLFGTGDVDTESGQGGFSLRIKSNGIFQIRVDGTSIFVDTLSAIRELPDDYVRWTAIFDRETQGKVSVKLYIDKTLVYQKTLSCSNSFDSASGEKKFGIGSAGTVHPKTTGYSNNRNTAEIRYGDFFLYKGIMTENQMQGFAGYMNEIAGISND